MMSPGIRAAAPSRILAGLCACALLAGTGAQAQQRPANYAAETRQFIAYDAPSMTPTHVRVLVKGDPATRIADIHNIEIVFKDGIGYDPGKLKDSVCGQVGLR